MVGRIGVTEITPPNLHPITENFMPIRGAMVATGRGAG